jgi:hypothetical protein
VHRDPRELQSRPEQGIHHGGHRQRGQCHGNANAALITGPWIEPSSPGASGSNYLQRAAHIHPTVSELIPTLLGDLEPFGAARADVERP